MQITGKSCFVSCMLTSYIYMLCAISRYNLANEVESSKKNTDDKMKLDFFDVFGEILGWIQIIVSPFLFAAIIGFVVYISNPNMTRLIIGIAIIIVGLIIGIILATKAWKGKGTIHLVSRVNASPELDHLDEETK